MRDELLRKLPLDAGGIRTHDFLKDEPIEGDAWSLVGHIFRRVVT